MVRALKWMMDVHETVVGVKERTRQRLDVKQGIPRGRLASSTAQRTVIDIDRRTV